jgi:5'(3')-deoxyribonucleotidase
MKPKVYIDQDGVLADFVGFFIEHLGVKSDKEVSLEDKYSYHEHHDLFLKLKPFPQNKILLQAVKEMFGSFYILTTPLLYMSEKCKEDKLLWVMKFLDIKPIDIIFSTRKEEYAENNILIDDYGVNITKWNNAGGIGIKYKARSNNYTVHDIVAKLKSIKENQ